VSRESSKLKESHENSGILDLAPAGGQSIVGCNLAILRERCPKITNSKAVGNGANRRLRLRPHTYRFLGIVGLSKPGSEGEPLQLRPTLPLKEERDAPIRPRKHTAPRRPSPLCSGHSAPSHSDALSFLMGNRYAPPHMLRVGTARGARLLQNDYSV
jgi:hypothetical protein